MKKLLLLVSIFTASFSHAQFADLDNVVTDFLLISTRYVTPGAEAAIHQSAAGWFQNADVLNTWDVDVSLHGNAIFLPKNRKTVSVSNSELINLRLQDGSLQANIPTALGGDDPIFFEGEIFGQEFDFQTLEGINEDEFYYGFVQATIGLPKKTQVSLRYAPSIPINDVEYLVYGIGVQHSIDQYFKNPYDVKLALQASYSRFNFDINFDPLEIPGVRFENVNIKSNSFLLQALASKRVNNFEPIASLGFTASYFGYELGGEGEALLNVVNNALENLEDSQVKWVANMGFNVYLGDFSIQSVTTFGEFINANLGLHYRFD